MAATGLCRHRHPAHPAPVRRHNTPVILLVTVCLAGNDIFLHNMKATSAMVEGWKQASNWKVGEYVIMPDHAHFFCVPGTVEFYSVRRWVGVWKRSVGSIQPEYKRAFMEDCWDTQMRDADHYNEKLSYVRRNPERKNLVEHWDEWPYRGKLFDIAWR